MTTSWTPQDGREPRTGELPVVRPPPPHNVRLQTRHPTPGKQRQAETEAGHQCHLAERARHGGCSNRQKVGKRET